MKTDIPKREAKRLALAYGRYVRFVTTNEPANRIADASRKLASVQMHTGVFIVDQKKLLAAANLARVE